MIEIIHHYINVRNELIMNDDTDEADDIDRILEALTCILIDENTWF